MRARPIRAAAPAVLLVMLVAAGSGGAPVADPVVDSQAPDQELAGEVLILVSEMESTAGLWARPVDPATLDDLVVHEPMFFGHHYTTALSGDGGTWAAAAWPSDGQQGGSLILIDLDEWSSRRLDVEIDAHVSEMAFDADGALYLVQPSGGGETLSRLHRGGDNLEPLVGLPDGFVPWDVRLLSPSRLIMFGVVANPTSPHLVEGSPLMVALDTESGDILYESVFEETEAGQRETAETDSGFVFHAPGVAWDPTRDLLYVVDAPTGEITTADLTTGNFLPKPGRSLMERLSRWLIPPARAKLVPGTDRQAVLSNDRRYLYSAGLRRELHRDGTEWRYVEIPLGVSITDTETFEVHAHADVPASEIALSPDGRHLFASHRPAGSNQPQESGVSILDAETLEQLEYITGTTDPSASVIRVTGFSPDGSLAYLTQWDRSGVDEAFETTVQILDLATLQITAERTFPGTYAATHPGR
jgi:hypothetical protein